ncbi:hypothetical protein [Streptomyces luteocolor]|uniref:hypothetical protein n=1 Tax=Streptomyces luteocolor TaxID=285500 RepID=UPI0008530FE6|nr:hypothetical protein [Streptomyces luteocolor]
MGLFNRTDKQCAQELVAAAMVTKDADETARVIRQKGLTQEEMARGAAYIRSGKRVTGRG